MGLPMLFAFLLLTSFSLVSFAQSFPTKPVRLVIAFTPQLLRKDMDLGLDAGRKFEVPMPLASATRDLIQSMIGQGWTDQDFATLLLQQAEASGIELKPENVEVGDGLS